MEVLQAPSGEGNINLIIVKFLQIEILKVPREKRDIISKETPIRLTAAFSEEKTEGNAMTPLRFPKGKKKPKDANLKLFIQCKYPSNVNMK